MTSAVPEAPPTWRGSVSLPLQLVNVSLVLLPCAMFVWLLTSLPDSIPASFDTNGIADRHMSPHELWPLGGLVLLHVLLMWGITWAMKKERSAVRLVEVVTIAINAAMVVVWIAVPLAAFPGFAILVGPAVVVTTMLSTVGVLAALLIFVPRMKTASAR